MKNSKIIELENLERRILDGLAAEWEVAEWSLPRHCRDMVKPPLFVLGDMEKLWGQWRRDVREITLSRKLVMNHPWHAVREVLHHEMAHQFADELLGNYGETPHGPAFHQACRLLKANPKASGDYPLLDERISDDFVADNDKIMLKVQKLLALAESSNLHESQAAMAAAHRLIEKYNIDLIQGNSLRNFASVFLGPCALRHPREQKYLCNLLKDFYFVRNVWISSWILEQGRMGRVMEMSGTPKNIQIATYVYDYVNQYIKTQWSQYRQRYASVSGRSRSDFAVGVIEGFRSTLEKQKAERDNPACGQSLIKLEDSQLTEYFNNRYPKIRMQKRTYAAGDRQIRSHGRDVGKQLVISKGVSATGSSGGFISGGK